MQIIIRETINRETLPGRVIQKAIGKNSLLKSDYMTMGFAHYSQESGQMAPHNHAEEAIYVLDAKDAWTRCGKDEKILGEAISLETGMILHFPAWEWHVFGFEKGGYLDIIFFYGQADQIRPEEKHS